MPNERKLPPGASLYLDLVRFAAAMAVFIGHAAGKSFTEGFLWQSSLYMREAVIIFFVLSGFVIGYVLDGKEGTAPNFASARVARLYSVIVPALILTFVCDIFGEHVSQAFYRGGPWSYYSDNLALRYADTFFMLNSSWLAPNMEPGINGPFWSLSFEMFYYVAIGLLVFAKGWKRLLGLACTCLIAGPAIIALFPLWLAGFALYRQTRGGTPNVALAVLATVLGGGLVLIAPFVASRIPEAPASWQVQPSVFQDYLYAAAFTAHLFGMTSLCAHIPKAPKLMVSVIRWLGGLTFPLYLLHRPLIQVFAVAPVGAADGAVQRLYLIGGTLLIVVLVTPICESLRRWLRAGIKRSMGIYQPEAAMS
jgi:peptidoglycan/LPS O-acetylase OafA/YrhL